MEWVVSLGVMPKVWLNVTLRVHCPTSLFSTNPLQRNMYIVCTHPNVYDLTHCTHTVSQLTDLLWVEVSILTTLSHYTTCNSIVTRRWPALVPSVPMQLVCQYSTLMHVVRVYTAMQDYMITTYLITGVNQTHWCLNYRHWKLIIHGDVWLSPAVCMELRQFTFLEAEKLGDSQHGSHCKVKQWLRTLYNKTFG